MQGRPPIRFREHHHGRVPRIRPLGQRRAPFDDLYHWVLDRSWTQFFAVVALLFVALNAMFAALFLAFPGSIVNARPGSFGDAFFFSVQTMATIGYGTMTPATTYANVVVTIEALVGMVSVALMTGITFAKFARPTARVLFADKAVISRRNGVPHLVFRMANWRHNQVVEAQLRVILLVTETTEEGETLRRPIELPLIRDRNAMFALTWLAMHRIDETSPFRGDDAFVRLRASNAELYLSLSGFDGTTMQTIHARYAYGLDDVIPDARFADILTVLPDGTRVIDYERFHDVLPLEGAAADRNETTRAT